MDDLDGNSLTCNEACCNLDDDPFGDYCYVVDPACEEFEWGYCRPESMSTPGCTDRPAGWSDSDGDDCYAYAYNGFCTTSGGYGAAWQEDWGTLEDYTQDGYDASTACCACGGGSGTYQGYDDTKCADSAGWADSDGDDCTSYTQFFWCTPDGHTGTGWHEEWGTLADFEEDGQTALQACCGCGGGSEGTYEGTQAAPKPNGDTAGITVPSGVAWVVASGPCTKDSNGCISSPNYPKSYGDSEKCIIGVNKDMIKPITAAAFSTEWGYDLLEINGKSYSGTLGPNGVLPLGAIVWSSDEDYVASGWKLCQQGDASDSPGETALEGTSPATSPASSPAPSPGTLDSNQKGMGVIVVLGVMMSVGCACWIKMRKSAPDSGIGDTPNRRVRA